MGRERSHPAVAEVLVDDLHERPHGPLGQPRVVVRIDVGRRGHRAADDPTREREVDVGAHAVVAVRRRAEDRRQALGQPALDAAGGDGDDLGRERIRRAGRRRRTRARRPAGPPVRPDGPSASVVNDAIRHNRRAWGPSCQTTSRCRRSPMRRSEPACRRSSTGERRVARFPTSVSGRLRSAAVLQSAASELGTSRSSTPSVFPNSAAMRDRLPPDSGRSRPCQARRSRTGRRYRPADDGSLTTMIGESYIVFRPRSSSARTRSRAACDATSPGIPRSMRHEASSRCFRTWSAL